MLLTRISCGSSPYKSISPSLQSWHELGEDGPVKELTAEKEMLGALQSRIEQGVVQQWTEAAPYTGL